jgi:hypothetical protein
VSGQVITENREALEAVLTSATFERSERLKRFLRYVCEMALAGKGEDINEHLIGIEVFDRGATYSPAEDSIVRRQAHALRKKLEEYYRTEGKNSPIQIELPLGHYTVNFRGIKVNEGLPSPPSVQKAAPKIPARISLLLVAASAIGIFALGWTLGQVSHGPNLPVLASDVPPSMRWIWQQWLRDRSGATICLSTPRTTVVKYYPDKPPEQESGPLLPVSPAREASLRRFFSLPPGGTLTEYPSTGQAKMGEAIAAIRLTSLLSSHQVPVRVEQSSFLEWNHVRSDNLIVFGHSESSPWVDRLIAEFPIRTRPSDGSLPRRITVSNPKSGERSVFPLNARHPEELYVLISMVPGIDGEHSLLVISGLTGMATQFGAEFLTTSSHADELASMLTKAGAKRGQDTYFQAVLQVNVRANTIPIRGNLQLVRVIERSSTLSPTAIESSGLRSN